jgi:hypothetical protein
MRVDICSEIHCNNIKIYESGYCRDHQYQEKKTLSEIAIRSLLSKDSEIFRKYIHHRYINGFNITRDRPVTHCVQVVLDININNIPRFILEELRIKRIAYAPFEIDELPNCTIIWYEFRETVPFIRRTGISGTRKVEFYSLIASKI